jgi:hypothetical protein
MKYDGWKDVTNALRASQNYIEWLEGENQRLTNWVNDLQSKLYVNCVYCGHRYGPVGETPVAIADVLKTHIESCPQHPMSALKKELERISSEHTSLIKQNESYTF